MKVYEAVFNEKAMEGVYALSVVENPAMEDMFIALSEEDKQERIELATIDEEKRLLLGAALIPNKKIYRKVDEHEFFITFSEQTIEKLAHNFSKNQNNNNSSLEHEVALNGMSVVENWIVEDTKTDKSALYGKQYDKGTWVTMMKVDNNEIWEKVKSGEIKGFSIDALLGLQEINFKTEINMNEEVKKSFLSELKEDIKTLFSTQKEEAEKEVESVEAEQKEEASIEEPAFDVEAFAKELKETLTAEFAAQLSKVKEQNKADVEAKENEIKELKAELAKEPEAEPIKANPENKSEKAEVKLNNNIPHTTKSRALNNIAQSMGW